MTEAELAMEEKLRKKRQEEQEVWQEYLKERAKARQKEEEDLRKLKERQQRRKAQRAEQEKLIQEMRRKQEEQHQRELEERRCKDAEAKRQRLEEAERKRQQMQDAIRKRDEEARRAWSVPKRTDPSVPPVSPLHIGYKDVMKTKEQLAEDKKIAMRFRIKPVPNVDAMNTSELKKTANELWNVICQLESDKYDLEEEHKRQEYHLKELSERQKLMNRNKALKMGLVTEDLSGKFPPKVRLASKYERHVDCRSFNEKTELFDGGYVQRVQKTQEQLWAEKINQFKESHGDKHVPKWDPSAPRKDVYEPGTVIYEESEDDDDDELVGKLRGYVEDAKREARNDRRTSTDTTTTTTAAAAAAQQRDSSARRRSSQMSTASSTAQGATRQQSATNATPRQSIISTTAAAPPERQTSHQEEEEEVDVTDEEEYTDEEVDEEEE